MDKKTLNKQKTIDIFLHRNIKVRTPHLCSKHKSRHKTQGGSYNRNYFPLVTFMSEFSVLQCKVTARSILAPMIYLREK